MQLTRLGEAIVVSVLPQPQAGEDGVFVVYQAVAVAALLRLVIISQCQKTVGRVRGRLRREVAEQFRTVIYCAIAIAVKREPSVVGVGGCLCQLPRVAVVVEVEIDAALSVRQIKAVAGNIHNYRAAFTPASDVVGGNNGRDFARSERGAVSASSATAAAANGVAGWVCATDSPIAVIINSRIARFVRAGMRIESLEAARPIVTVTLAITPRIAISIVALRAAYVSALTIINPSLPHTTRLRAFITPTARPLLIALGFTSVRGHTA